MTIKTRVKDIVEAINVRETVEAPVASINESDETNYMELEEELLVADEPILEYHDEHTSNDNVDRPLHYLVGDIECIDYIADKLGADGFCDYCVGNVMKYISRWRFKGGQEDLAKAMKYLEWAIETAEMNDIGCVPDTTMLP